MKKNLSIFVVAAVVLGGIATVAGQPETGTPRWMNEDVTPRVERKLAYMESRLELTDEQVAQIRETIEARHTEARNWFNQNPEAPLATRQAFMEGHRTATTASIRALLTEEQQVTFDAEGGMKRGYAQGYRDGCRGGSGWSGRAQRGGGFDIDRLTQRLDLTPEQVGQVAEARAQSQVDFRAELDDILTEEQKADFESMRGRRARW